jgi:hypothetical protein
LLPLLPAAISAGCCCCCCTCCCCRRCSCCCLLLGSIHGLLLGCKTCVRGAGCMSPIHSCVSCHTWEVCDFICVGGCGDVRGWGVAAQARVHWRYLSTPLPPPIMCNTHYQPNLKPSSLQKLHAACQQSPTGNNLLLQ